MSEKLQGSPSRKTCSPRVRKNHSPSLGTTLALWCLYTWNGGTRSGRGEGELPLVVVAFVSVGGEGDPVLVVSTIVGVRVRCVVDSAEKRKVN